MNPDFFKAENLNGEYSAINDCLREGIPIALFGVSDEYKHFIASLINGRVVYITSSLPQAKKAAEAIGAFSGEEAVLLPPKDEVLLYKNALSKDSFYSRLNALYKIERGARIIVTDIEGAMQLFPDKMRGVSFEKGKSYDYSLIPAKLISLGYAREYAIESAGTFAVRGDILDVFPVNSAHPYRIDFFGDEIEAIRPYDAETGERLPAENYVDILAASDVFVQKSDEEKILSALSAGVKKSASPSAFNRLSDIAENIKENLYTPAAAQYLMPILGGARDFFAFIGDAALIFDEAPSVYEAMNAVYAEHTERFNSLSAGGEAFPFSINQIIPPENFISGIKNCRRAAMQRFASDIKLFSPLKLFNLKASPVGNYMNDFTTLLTDIKAWQTNGYRIIICCGDGARAAKMTDFLTDNFINAKELPLNSTYLKGVTVCEEKIEKGLILHEEKIAIIGYGNVYTKNVSERRIKKRRGDVFTAPEIGDYAVHEIHGIGKVTGTKKIETTDGIKEYIAVEYGGGDYLYVPVEQIDILTKYTGGDQPKLSKIGGAEFARVKERVRSSIKKLAIDLKGLYAARNAQKGYAFPENKELMDEFAYAFDYTETPDQLSSIAEITADMCSNKVMDRLLCGDVGFGKTEVALRAAYLCVLGGKQAALMCPSTILSSQHFSTAEKRFKDFGVSVELINRFVPQKKQEEILSRLAAGKVDLIIGTHRLLSKDVVFKDLGLLIIDEEQRFGVEHKEKLKTLKKNVDCLTMTATPIPRTLDMSLSGIRDISNIDTPPEKRLPVQTYVVEESESTMRDACLRELSRGGQVFILYNRVESIYSFAARVKTVIPEGKVIVAHGQMEKSSLEQNVIDFYQGKADILVTTTIIENGIDLPNANTMIVIDADRLGVSQLYQLRGRVGRGTRMAHAYFMYKPQKVMTSDAQKRLETIMQFTSLGSGYKIALRDLQIRGAGNVLGAEQHGHMDRVGYELYSKLLKEELTGEEQTIAELDINASAYIPENYIESSAGRMDCYKQIAEIKTSADYKRVLSSIEDTYGRMPESVFTLLVIAVLKSYCAKFNVKRISVNEKGGCIEFPSLASLNKAGLQKAIDYYRGEVALSMVNSPAIKFKAAKSPVFTMRSMIKFLKYAQVSQD